MPGVHRVAADVTVPRVVGGEQLTSTHRRQRRRRGSREAEPVGGRSERLQLNEDTLYAGQPYDPTPTQALETLPEVRRLLFAGRYAETGCECQGHPQRGLPRKQ